MVRYWLLGCCPNSITRNQTDSVKRYTVRKITSYNLYLCRLQRIPCIDTDYNLQIIILIYPANMLCKQLKGWIDTAYFQCQYRKFLHEWMPNVSTNVSFVLPFSNIYCMINLFLCEHIVYDN